VFRRRRFLTGMDWRQLRWYTPDGTIVTGEQWADRNARSVAIYLEGQDAPDHAADGSLLIDDDFLVLVNGWWEPLTFTLPQACADQTWTADIDTFDPSATARHGKPSAGEQVTLDARSVLVLRGSPTA
jgi:isoamylase